MAKIVETFGKYILLEKLAAGGMAEVYLAKSTGASGIAKFVAVKRILPQFSDKQEYIDMFKDEAKTSVNLNHGNIVSIFDFGVERKQFFLVMEYVEGQNLRQVLNHLKKENKYFSIDQIVYVIKETAAGLDHAHRCLDSTSGRPLNITHRDISPQNVMLSFEGEIKIVDFGIAKNETQMDHTQAGTIKGKFGYMSPEQADGQTVDLRTDVFSLGIVLWELLANDRLFVSNSEAATLRKVRECQIPSLRKINPSIPPELERICNKALAKDKSLRYQTASAFHRDLNRFLNTQYPEFSAHDFSVFMKSAFSQMFVENRKKLIEYAKVQLVAPDEPSKGVDKQQGTHTNTSTETGHTPPSANNKFNGAAQAAPSSSTLNLDNDDMDDEGSLKLDISPTQSRISLDELKLKEPKRKSSVVTAASLNANSSPKISISGTGAPNTLGLPNSSHLPTTSKMGAGNVSVPVNNSIPQPMNSPAIMGATSPSISKTGFTSTNTNYKPRPLKRNNTLSPILILIGLMLISFYLWKNNYLNVILPQLPNHNNIASQTSDDEDPINKDIPKKNVNNGTAKNLDANTGAGPTPTTKLEIASKAQVQVIIESIPSSAIIQVNGKQEGITPGTITVEANKEFKMELFKDGYLPYTKTEKIQKEGETIRASLQLNPTVGYIFIDVKNGGINPIIKVNNIQLSEKLPIKSYAVPAGIPIKIEASNPFTGLYAEETITVGQNQKKSINLILVKKRNANTN